MSKSSQTKGSQKAPKTKVSPDTSNISSPSQLGLADPTHFSHCSYTSTAYLLHILLSLPFAASVLLHVNSLYIYIYQRRINKRLATDIQSTTLGSAYKPSFQSISLSLYIYILPVDSSPFHSSPTTSLTIFTREKWDKKNENKRKRKGFSGNGYKI